MMKIYLLDTSVLIEDPQSPKKFKKVYIPIDVIEELDKLKTSSGKIGQQARLAIKFLDSWENTKNNNIYFDSKKYPNKLQDIPDNRILASGIFLQRRRKNQKVVVVSKDFNLRLKAKIAGLETEDYNENIGLTSDLYSGVEEIEDAELSKNLFEKEFISCPQYLKDLFPNQCLIVKGEKTALARKIGNHLKSLMISNQKVRGIESKNKEQALALDLLQDTKIPLVTLSGIAGTGKTLLSIAAGLHLIDKGKYKKLVVYKPTEAVGNDIGYLPGSTLEKMIPWMGSIFDNLESILSQKGRKFWDLVQDYQDHGIIEFNAIAHIRGRSINDAFIMIDECFPYDQYITTENGKEKIGVLYKKYKSNNKLPLIKTFNEEKNIFEFNKILGAVEREPRDLLQITCGNRKVKCTKNHKFLTDYGWVEAQNLKIGQLIKTSEPETNQLLKSINEDQKQIILGSFLGDGHISNIGKSRFRLKCQHGISQKEYCEWKASMFHASINFIEKNGFSQKPACSFASKSFGFENEFPLKKNNCPQWILDDLDPRGLAIWFMDDGSINKEYNRIIISTCSFDEDSQIRFVKKLNSFGISCVYKNYDNYFYLSIDSDGTEKLLDITAPYIHQNIGYKTNFKYGDYKWDNNFNKFGYTVVDEIKKLLKKEVVYDLEIEKNHNFIISPGGKNTGGIIAHNCQNLRPEDVKTILTRVGHNTKIVMTGDIEQIDKDSLDSETNGLTYVVERFKNSELAGHLTLVKGERSALAAAAAKIL